MTFPADKLRELLGQVGCAGHDGVLLGPTMMPVRSTGSSHIHTLEALVTGGPEIEPVVVPHASLVAAVAKADKVNLEVKGGLLVVKAGRSRHTMPIKTSLPNELPAFDGGIELPLARFREIVRFAAQGCAGDVGPQSCVQLTGLGRGLRAVGTNGMHLFCLETPCPIPFDPISLPATLVKASSVLKGNIVKIGEVENRLALAAGNTTLYHGKMAGTFPNFDTLLNGKSEYTVDFDAQEMAQAVQSVSYVLSLDTDATPAQFRLDLENEVVTVKSVCGQDSAEAELPYEQKLPDSFDDLPSHSFNLNHKPLLDFLAGLSGKVRLATAFSCPLKFTAGEKTLLMVQKRGM